MGPEVMIDWGAQAICMHRTSLQAIAFVCCRELH